jgi:hypothetical protein
MRILGATILVILLPSFLGIAQDKRDAASDDTNVRFAPLHVTIDPAGQTMAAYQFELKAVRGQVKIVGVEGGEHAAFTAAPFYDPAALAQDRIIIAAYNTGDNLPNTKIRVATIHLQIVSQIEPEYEIQLMVASNLEGTPIEASIACEKGESM